MERMSLKLQYKLKTGVTHLNRVRNSSLSSGRIATKEISNDLLSAKKTGEEATMTFMKERVISNNEDFFSLITKLKSKTFADLSKKTTIKLQNKEEILKADQTLFARMAVVAHARCAKTLPWTITPWSLAAVDGSYAKTTKSKLAELTEKGIDALEEEPGAAVWILDAMAILQALTNIPPTFADLTDQVFSVVMHMGSNAVRIDFVTDRYPKVSIKGLERLKRGLTGLLTVRLESGAQRCPRQWKKFLPSGENKEALISFL